MSDSKDVIYIDVDDEITSIIDKVQSSKKKIVALVLPKRAAVLQSIVNMKLLKKTGDKADKNLVLITSEAGLMPLAGTVGLHVAKTLQSKPEIPEVPDTPKADEEEIHDVSAEDEEPEIDPKKSIGELAGSAALAGVQPEETIDMDNTEPEPKAAAKKPKKSKKSMVPDFDSFRKKLFLGAGVFVLLIALWIFGFKVLPKARITIKTDTSSMDAGPVVNVDTAAQQLDLTTSTLPGKYQEVKKTSTQTAGATGQKDVGTKAGGTVTIRNCEYSDPFTLGAGTRFTGDNGKVFVSTASITVPKFSGSALTCTKSGSSSGKATVNVQAVENGDSYNVNAQNYTFSYSSSGVDAVGSAMSGGTTKIAKVVSQQDLDGAKAKLPNNKEAAKSELTKALEDAKLYPMGGTFSEGAPQITSSPNVGEPAESFTVTSITTYGMVGVNEEDLKKVIAESLKAQIDENKQQVQEYGLDKAGFSVADNKNNAKFQISVQTTVSVGPKINADDLKAQVGGKKSGQIRDSLQNQPGIKEVDVKLSPFWVSKAPKKASKITVIFEKTNDNSNP